MRKNFKIVTLMALAATALGAGALGLELNNRSAAAETETLPDFYVRGASVRLANDDKTGIRFSIMLKTTLFEQAGASAKTGVYLVPSDELKDLNGDGWTSDDFTDAQNVITADSATSTNEWVSSSAVEGYMESIVYIYGIPKDSYNRPISAVGYATLDGETYYYTDPVSRSMSGVAYEAVKNGEVSEEAVSTYLTYPYTVAFLDDDGTPLDTKTYKYGDTFTVPETEKEGKIFLGWYKRTGTNSSGEAVWSETYCDFSQKTVWGNMQYKASWIDAPTAFGTTMTVDMFKQPQIDAGQSYLHPTVYDVVEKDGVDTAVIKTQKKGLSAVAQSGFNDLLPATAKDTDKISVDVYFYETSAFIFSSNSASSSCSAGTWHTFECTVGAWKSKPNLYSNGTIGFTNFVIINLELKAFGQDVTFTDVFTNAEVVRKDEDTVIQGTAQQTCKPTVNFLALLPSDASDTDIVTFKIWCTNRASAVFGESKNNYWPTEQWVEYSVTVATFKSGGIYSNGIFYLKDFTYAKATA